MNIIQLLLKIARNTYSISRLELLKLGYGKRFQVGRNVVVRHGFTVRMEDRLDSCVQIGSGTFFNDGCMLNSTSSIEIGDNCLFGQGVKIYDHDHEFSAETIFPSSFLSSPVVIGNGCWIGSNVVILKGVTIGDNVIIGAGAVVSKSVPDNSVVIAKQDIAVKPRCDQRKAANEPKFY